MSDSKFTANADFRGNVYGILAFAFSPPKQGDAKLYEAILNAQSALSSTDVSSLQQRELPPPSFEDLNREYLKLFVGPGHIQCPPYEAVYRKERPTLQRGLVMGPSTADVRRRYGEANLNLSEKFTDLPDHIAAEMEFMHYLCTEESKLTEQGHLHESEARSKMQRGFFKEHLKPWAETFADCVLRSTDSTFYKAAARLMKAFVNGEYDYLLGGDPT